MNTIRQELLKAFIAEREVATIKELHSVCPEVTTMTLHRDLDALEKAGYLIKIHGGARSVKKSQDPQFDERMQENIEAKREIAQKALALIRPDSSIFIDAGTTNVELAKILPDINMTIFTTGPNIALEMRHLINPSINLCCGNLNRANLALSGYNTLEMLESINIDLAFIGVSGCSVHEGFTCGKESEMLVKQKVIKKARTSVILCDSGKFSRLMPYTFAKLSDINYLFTDRSAPEYFIAAAREAGIRIL